MQTEEQKEVAVCRGCGKHLIGEPYYKGAGAYLPRTMEAAKVNFYGGYVCSERCDFNASLELERTMPGHTASQSSLSSPAHNHYKKNWNQ